MLQASAGWLVQTTVFGVTVLTLPNVDNLQDPVRWRHMGLRIAAKELTTPHARGRRRDGQRRLTTMGVFTTAAPDKKTRYLT